MPPRHLLTFHGVALAIALLVATSALAQVPPRVSATAHGGAPESDGAAVVNERQTPFATAPSQLGVSGMRRSANEQRPQDRRVRLLLRALAGVQEEYSRYSLRPANALIVVGGITMLMHLPGLIVGALFAQESDTLEYVVLAGSTGILIGLGFLVIGVVTRSMRVSRRLPYERRIRAIKHELDGYGVLTALDVRFVPSGAVLTGTVTF